MTDFIFGVLGIFDDTIRAALGVPVLAVLLSGLVLFAVLGLVLLVKDSVHDNGRRK